MFHCRIFSGLCCDSRGCGDEDRVLEVGIVKDVKVVLQDCDEGVPLGDSVELSCE